MKHDRYDTITDWAEELGLTLDEALEGGVSQDDDGTIQIPRELWKWLRSEGKV